MPTELRQFVETAPLVDTHEHLLSEARYRDLKPDILMELFAHYVAHDLRTAGGPSGTVENFWQGGGERIEERFAAFADAWKATRFTGYGEATRIAAERFFGMSGINGPELAAAQERLPERWPEGDRRTVLEEQANLAHVQTDDFVWDCSPDPAGPDFFFRDITWRSFAAGDFSPDEVEKATGVTIRELDHLREAMAVIFTREAPTAIAVKTQHAYNRTLAWQERGNDDAAALLQKRLGGEDLTTAERNALGDWCLARGVELATEHDLPIKIHCGYYAGNYRLPLDWINAANLNPLLKRYEEARFVLMHLSYPFTEELVAMAKQFPNLWIDCCWAWGINPVASSQFLHHFLAAVPYTKLFAFGGDVGLPRMAAAYSVQARNRIASTLEAWVDAGNGSEADAIEIAEAIMQRNQTAVFRPQEKAEAARSAG